MNKPVLTKSCTVCGLQKPLSAFLELGGQRAIYGNICSSCRKTAMEKAKLPKDSEGSTTSTSGHRVDSKAKVQGDINKEKEREKIKDLYREEGVKDEKVESALTQDREKTKEHERRKLDKSSFLTAPRKPIEAKQTERATQQAQQIEQSAQQAESSKLERQQKGTDFSSPFEGTRVSQERFKSAVFRQFATWIGANSPIGQTMGNALNQQNKANAEKNAKNAAKSDEPLTDYIKQEWKPKSGR